MKTSILTLLKNFFLLWLLFAATQCSDFLDKTVQGSLLDINFPETEQDAINATNAIYNTLRIAAYNSGTFPILDIMSDDALKGSNPTDAAATIGAYDRFQHIPTEGSLQDWWNTLYQGVRRANIVLEKVPPLEINESLKTRLVGEASFLRALFYFDLVRAWGGVPIVTNTAAETELVRSSREDVYNLIESDLLTAITNLPEKSAYAAADMGRATKGAARGLLAKVYLFQNNFTNAERYALEVINSGQYSLEPEFTRASNVAGEFGVESVFEVGAIGQEGIENGGNQYANVQGVRGTPNRGWGFNRPSPDLIAAFGPNDPRREATVSYLGEVLDEVTIAGDGGTPDEIRDAAGNIIEIETYNQKVWTPGINVPTQWEHNRRILRYADVLLIAAEASNENNKAAQALTFLNQVRARARGNNAAILPDISETNKDALRDIILNERRLELAMESHRFWDLVRTNRAAAELGPLGFIPGKHELLPIPQVEIDLTQGRITQNPQW